MATFSKVCSPLASSIRGSRINPPLPSPPPPRTRRAGWAGSKARRPGWREESGEWPWVRSRKRDEQQATVRKENGWGATGQVGTEGLSLHCPGTWNWHLLRPAEAVAVILSELPPALSASPPCLPLTPASHRASHRAPRSRREGAKRAWEAGPSPPGGLGRPCLTDVGSNSSHMVLQGELGPHGEEGTPHLEEPARMREGTRRQRGPGSRQPWLREPL